jgi:O-methyltransferase involved in polyketide biosynthesis
MSAPANRPEWPGGSNEDMTDKRQAELGDVQMTLFVPLAARARETRKKRPALRDPKAVEMIESIDFDESSTAAAGARS